MDVRAVLREYEDAAWRVRELAPVLDSTVQELESHVKRRLEAAGSEEDAHNRREIG